MARLHDARSGIDTERGAEFATSFLQRQWGVMTKAVLHLVLLQLNAKY